MNKQWQQVKRSDRVKEYFMIGEFIQSDNWVTSSPPSLFRINCPYIKDCIEFNWNQYGREISNEIRVTEITHGSSCKNMLSIINDGGFRPATKHIPGIGHMDLVWFGLKIEEREIDSVKENYRLCAQDLLQDRFLPETVGDVVSHFACSAPFQPMSRYGNFKFTLNIQEVLHAYKMQFGNGSLEMRKLGTFAYKMETMHVILVCQPGTEFTDQFTDQCPLMSDDPIIKPDENFEAWTWMPDSTGDQKVYVTPLGYVFTSGKRWEHVSFAFNVPQGRCLEISNLNEHVSLCLWLQIKNHYVSDINKAIANMLESIEHEEQFNREALARMLMRMIHGFIAEMHLYAKTTSNFYQRHLVFDLENVKQKLRELLPMENTSFN